MDDDSAPDHELLERWRTREDLRAWYEFSRRHLGTVSRFLAALGPDTHRFISVVFDSLKADPVRLEPGDRGDFALLRIAYQVAAVVLRVRPSSTSRVGKVYSDGSEARLVQLAFRRLHWDEQALLLLRDGWASSTQELAAIVGEPADAVDARLSRAHQRLDAALDELRAMHAAPNGRA